MSSLRLRSWAVWASLVGGLLYGGTALPAGGIGGTGISAYGPIERFGSVFVDGQEYRLRHAHINTDGRPARRAALHRGQVVLVRARRVRGHIDAWTVSVRHAIEGPVTRADGGRLTVLGQRVSRAHARTDFSWSTLRPGDVVRVSGFAVGRRTWVATRIHRVYRRQDRPRHYPLLLRGVLRMNPGGERIVRGVPAAEASGRAQPGQPVVLWGFGGVQHLHWTRVVADPLLLGPAGTQVDLTGYVRQGGRGWQQNHVPLRFGVQPPAPRVLVSVRGFVRRGGVIAVSKFHPVSPEGVAAPPSVPLEDQRPRELSQPPERPELERPPVLSRPQIERPERGH